MSARVLVLPAVAVLALGGCVTPASAQLPDSVSVNLKQYRSDIAAGRLEIQVINGSDDPLTITAASVTSPRFASTAVWPKDSTTVPAGTTRDLPVTIPDIVCDAQAAERVQLSFTLADGTSGTAELTPTDTHGDVDRVSETACFERSVESIAVLEGTRLVVSGSGTSSTAVLEVDVTPSGSSDSVVLNTIGETVLLASASEQDGWPLALTVNGTDAASQLELDLLPQRCDAHVIAEDKAGTRLPVTATLSDGTSDSFALPLADGLREQLLDFVAARCGLVG
ncbi:MAG: hypothetical protein QM635_06495 [Microbacteriaceae bacterium]